MAAAPAAVQNIGAFCPNMSGMYDCFDFPQARPQI
jgi:hypothetical protein